MARATGAAALGRGPPAGGAGSAGGDAIDAAVGTPLDDSPTRAWRARRCPARAHRREQDRARGSPARPRSASPAGPGRSPARRSAAARTRVRGCSPRRGSRPPRSRRLGGRLGLEAGALLDRVVELRVRVGQLAPATAASKRSTCRSSRWLRASRRPHAGSRRRTSASRGWPRRSRRRPRTSAALTPTPTRTAP